MFAFCVLYFFGVNLLGKLDATHSAEEFGKIVFANVIFRHGDRTPINPYPNDPYRNESLWSVPFGQLTNLGKHQQLLLGRWLRNRYSHLLPEAYTLYDVFIRSTDVDRTLMSAAANLAGLYPPKDGQIWDSIKWMPIPVHTTAEKEDNVLAMKKYCPRYGYEIENLRNSLEMKQLDQNNSQLYAYLTEHTGRKVNSLEDLEYIYNILYIEELNNKSLPEWTKAVYPYKLKPLAEMSFTLPCYNRILKRLKAGPLVGEMVEHLLAKSRNVLVPNRKLWLYSAHDETIANLLMALDIFDLHCPPYAATVLIELRLNSKNQHIVTISYKNSTEEPVLLTLPDCTPGCPLEQFVKFTKNITPMNWEIECLFGLEQNESMNPILIIEIFKAAVFVLLTMVVLIILSLVFFYKPDNAQYYLRLINEPI